MGWRNSGGITALSVVAALLVALAVAQTYRSRTVPTHHLTPAGDAYAQLGYRGDLAIVLTSTADKALGGKATSLPAELRKRGFVVVSVDLPCHGRERGELDCWARRAPTGDFVTPFLGKLRRVAADMRRRGVVNGDRVLVAGISRGGYLAMRSAVLPEVTDVLAMCPVTDLGRLREFAGVPVPASYRLNPSLLAGERLFLQIGSQDQRVGTDATLALASAISQAGGADITLHMGPSPGHNLPDESEAVAWAGKRHDLSR